MVIDPLPKQVAWPADRQHHRRVRRSERLMANHRPSTSRPAGFTLIELLVVIAILMAVPMPALLRARHQGKNRDRSHPDQFVPETPEGYRDLYRLQRATWGRLGYAPTH